jgi:hypothetical protein
MRYLVLLEATQPDTPPPPDLMEAIFALGEEATRAGALLDTAGLLPSVTGARLELTADGIGVTDGPFAETKELISYALWDVRSKAEAVEWTSRFLDLHRDRWPGWTGGATVLQVMVPGDVPPSP